jgi:hypothetical protein
MKTKLKLVQARMFCAAALGIGLSFSLVAATPDSAATAPAKTSIPWSQIGAKAGADYQGDGLAVSPTAGGARLRCVFQRLEGEATREGLWLTSTVTNGVSERFRVVATSVGRQSAMAGDERLVPISLRESSARSAMFIVNVPGDSQAPLGAACDDDGSARRPMPLLTELERDSVGRPFYKHGAPSGATAQVGAGGWFTTAGGSAATSIAKWDGSSWAALGSGMSSGTYGYSVDPPTLSSGSSVTFACFSCCSHRGFPHLVASSGSSVTFARFSCCTG